MFIDKTKMTAFEDSIAWQKSKQLSHGVYGKFSASRDFGFRDQIQRATISVMDNIAEGFERGGNRELRQFLYIAKGLCGEVRSMLVMAHELHYLSDDEYTDLAKLAKETSQLISGFIKSLDIKRDTFGVQRAGEAKL